MKTTWQNIGANNGLWYRVVSDKGHMIPVALPDGADELVAILNALEEKAEFGNQCYQDRCEGAFTEVSVVKKLEAEHAKRDWRIGISCKPKYRTHELFYESGVIDDVFPSGHGGIFDEHGVLKIRMASGRVLLAKADEWVTA